MARLRLLLRRASALTFSLLLLAGASHAKGGQGAKEDASKHEEESTDSNDSNDSGDADRAAPADDSEEPAAHAAEPKETERPPAEKDLAFGHAGQVGLRAGLVVGYRMVLRYSDSPFCRTPDPTKPSDKQPKFCGHGAPLAADFGLSFGVFDFLEPFAWARLGLAAERETDTKPLVVLGLGLRLYTMSDAAFKIFIEPALGWELEGGRGTLAWQANSPQYKQDLLFHVAAGPQFDFARGVGAYVTAGVSADVLRALGSSFDLNFGVQGRYP